MTDAAQYDPPLDKGIANIQMLESDDDLQDAVLSVHHAFVITLANTPAAKIIENHMGAAFVKNVPQGVLQATPF
jgi:polysaccharide deacetylase 2 family uncharacterized protein YibQ